ncbi:MAG: type I secretion system permease/ATPase [Gammaproteobacteria bacterium]
MAEQLPIKQNNYLHNTLKLCQHAFIWVGLFSFVINILMLTLPIYMLQVFDRVLTSQSLETLFFLTFIAILALLTLALIDIGRNQILIAVSDWLGQKLNPNALYHGVDAMLCGNTYSPQALKDINTVRYFLSNSAITALFDSPWVPLYLLVIFLLHPLLGLIATIGAGILFALALLNEATTHKLLTQANLLAQQAEQHANLTLRNAEVSQAMGMLPALITQWHHQNQDITQLQNHASTRANIILASSKFMRLCLQLLMLGVGAWLVIENRLTPGGMIAGTILLSRALAPVEQAISTWKQLVNARQAYQRLIQFFQKDTARNTDIKLPAPSGKLTLENVFYVPPHSKTAVLSNINLEIQAHETVAIIGPSGAGKSTLARLMLGIWPATSGYVRLDGADIYQWKREEIGRYLGYLPQDIELFNSSIKHNIARMAEVDDEAVIAASQLAGVHQLILNFPDGYDTALGTQQFLLSGGQRQRIALARALYGIPEVLVLDEPNANLDKEGEYALEQALQQLRARGSTIIIISHRPNVLQLADKILILQEGRIKAFDNRDKILQMLKQANSSNAALYQGGRYG